MLNTPLTDKHLALGAKMAPFAGYNMPISYTNITEEHQAVRQKAGLFDVSHMGEFIVRGKEALQLVNAISSNDASKMAVGDAQYACMPNEQGGIIDDLLIYRLTEDMCSADEQAFMLVVNASNIEKDWNWISQHNTFDARLINISNQTALLALQGPLAIEVLQPLTSIHLDAINYYSFTKGEVAGIDNVLVSATGYTGSGGFELYVHAENAAELWTAILQNPLVSPVGLGARDTLRLEMGYCLYGNDIDDTTSPLEAGLGWITKLNKPDFVGKDAIVALKNKGIQRKLIGFTLEDRRVPRHGYAIENMDGQTIGQVCSGTASPSLGYPIGMGYVAAEYVMPGTAIYIVAGGKKLAATVAKLPFLDIKK